MATTFHLRMANIGISPYGDVNSFGGLLDTQRGASATQSSSTSVASATWVSIRYFISRPLAAFSLSGAITCNLRGSEAANQANASLGVRVYKWNPTTGLSASLGQASATVELGTTEGVVTASVTPTTTAFADGECLVFEVGAINIGTMGGGRLVSLFHDGPTAGASGDSYITITPNVTPQRRVTLTE